MLSRTPRRGSCGQAGILGRYCCTRSQAATGSVCGRLPTAVGKNPGKVTMRCSLSPWAMVLPHGQEENSEPDPRETLKRAAVQNQYLAGSGPVPCTEAPQRPVEAVWDKFNWGAACPDSSDFGGPGEP